MHILSLVFLFSSRLTKEGWILAQTSLSFSGGWEGGVQMPRPPRAISSLINAHIDALTSGEPSETGFYGNTALPLFCPPPSPPSLASAVAAGFVLSLAYDETPQSDVTRRSGSFYWRRPPATQADRAHRNGTAGK